MLCAREVFAIAATQAGRTICFGSEKKLNNRSPRAGVMFKKILLLLSAIIIAFLGYVAVLPPIGVVERSATIAAPADKIFPHINNLKKWDAWSPWAKLDPNAKSSFSGPEQGMGAVFAWDGNMDVGKGQMTIVESKPNESLKIKLDFTSPTVQSNDVYFVLQPEGDGTKVTWTMSGERSFVDRIFCTLFRVDATVGAMYEKGLESLGKAAKGA
jgi:hypothetical protein